MFHDLLLCLLGYAGDIVIVTYKTIKDEDGSFKTFDRFKLASDFAQNLHPSEVTIINDLASLGHSYKFIHDFVQEIRGKSSSKGESFQSGNTTGVYLRDMCNGLEELLVEYTALISSIEQTARHLHEIPPLQQLQSDLSQVHTFNTFP